MEHQNNSAPVGAAQESKFEQIIGKGNESIDNLTAELDGLVDEYNDAVMFNEPTSSISEEIEKVVGKITDLKSAVCMAEIAKTDDPMVSAIRRLDFETVRVAGDKESSVKGAIKVVPVNKPIDLIALNKMVKGGIGKKQGWYPMCEAINFQLTARRAIELGIDPSLVCNTFAYSTEARKVTSLVTNYKEYDRSKADQLLREDIKAIVSAMIGDFDVSENAINYLLMIFQKKDNRKALGISTVTHRALLRCISEICHQILEGDEFTIRFKTSKKK